MHKNIHTCIERLLTLWDRHASLLLAMLCGFGVGMLGTVMFAQMSTPHESAHEFVHEAAPLQIEEPPLELVPVLSLPASSRAASAVRTPHTLIAEEPPHSASSSISNAVLPSSAASSLSSSALSETPESIDPETFPAFGRTVFPVSKVPNWGAMRSAAEWDRSYRDIRRDEFVSIPRYDLDVLTTPMATFSGNPDAHIPELTAKLFYSTRFFGRYDLDSGEFAGSHAGIDLKLAPGTPIGAIAGGRVERVATTETLGRHVVIEHRLKSGEVVYSIYGHLAASRVTSGQDMEPGQLIGTVGMTGNTSAPHVHLQIDRKVNDGPHAIVPSRTSSAAEADRLTLHPIRFIQRYASGE